MSSPLVQQQRKAQAINDAVEAVRAVKPDTELLDEALGEPLIADEDRIVAIVAELAEMVARLERAIDHTADHVVGDLTKRVERLEKAQPKSRKK